MMTIGSLRFRTRLAISLAKLGAAWPLLRLYCHKAEATAKQLCKAPVWVSNGYEE